jgi:predicted metal-dependent hydrolase
MIVRRMRFPYPEGLKAWWNPARPEFSQIVNAASLGMPYLEPYLIETMRKAREKIVDPRVLKDLDLYVGQESTHFRQHQQFNKRLAELGYAAVPRMEATLKNDYEALGRTRSLAFNVAYAEGFEAMALTIGHMLIEDRDYLFGNADPAVSSLILWHFVEEIEHKCATYDVFKALDGRYLWRIYGLLYAMIHIMARTRQGYRAMLIEDGRWFTWTSRLALYKVLIRIFAKLTPRLLRIMRPGYDPREVPDPQWMTEWRRFHTEGRENLGELDTSQLASPIPIPRAA